MLQELLEDHTYHTHTMHYRPLYVQLSKKSDFNWNLKLVLSTDIEE